MNKEEREQFFALYLNQRVLISPMTLIAVPLRSVYLSQAYYSRLLLTSIYKISEKHAIVISEMLEGLAGFSPDHKRLNVGLVHAGLKYLDCYDDEGTKKVPCIIADFLRSEGYAVSYGARSVKDLIDEGIVKLKE